MWTVYTNVCTSYTHRLSPYHRPFPSIICVSQLSGAIIMNKTQENPRGEWSSGAAVRVHGLLALVWGLGGTGQYIRVGSQGVLTFSQLGSKEMWQDGGHFLQGHTLDDLTSSSVSHIFKLSASLESPTDQRPLTDLLKP